MNAAEACSAVPPISPMRTTASVLGVAVEHAQGFDLLGADDWVAADADAGGLADPGAGELVDGLVDEGAGAGDDADAAGAEDVGGHDADTAAGGGVNDAGAVGADQAALGAGERLADADHVVDRDALRDADDERDFCVDGFEDGVGCAGRGDVDDGAVGVGAFDRVLHGGEDGEALKACAAAEAGVDAGDDFGVVGERATDLVLALVAEALNHDAGAAVEKDAHAGTFN